MRYRIDVTLASDDQATMERLHAALASNAFILEPVTVTVHEPHKRRPETFRVEVEDPGSPRGW